MSGLVLRIALLAIMLPAFSFLSNGMAFASGYQVVIDGSPVRHVMAELKEGQLMVAVRPFVTAMGGDVSWLADDWRATVDYAGSQVAFWIGSRTAFQDGKRLEAPVKPYLMRGSSMVPAWWLTARLGALVRFTGRELHVETGRLTGAEEMLAKRDYLFPFPKEASYEPYYDSWGDARFWRGERLAHEGTDILAEKGSPVVAVAAGTVVRFGWNTLGGYRVTVRLEDAPGYLFYYAHLDRYAPGIHLGARVRAGQLLGYSGSTGEGPEGTEGRFVPHLHFGIYAPEGPVNPYPYLRIWERNRVSLQ